MTSNTRVIPTASEASARQITDVLRLLRDSGVSVSYSVRNNDADGVDSVDVGVTTTPQKNAADADEGRVVIPIASQEERTAVCEVLKLLLQSEVGITYQLCDKVLSVGTTS